jgi:hypothetical protein
MAFYGNAPLPDTNARQTATTIRPSSTALLTIDSEDRYKNYLESRANPTDAYNFSIQKVESLMPGFITRLGISEVVFPWTIPNVNVKTNAIYFTYDISGQPIVENVLLSLAVGFYTPVRLASAMQQAIRNIAVGGVPIPELADFSFQYGSELEPYFTYYTNNDDVNVLFEPLPYNSAVYPFGTQTKQLFELLGFTEIATSLAPLGQGAYTLCQAIRYVDIVCNQLTNSQAQKDQTSQTVARDMLCRLYLGNASFNGQTTVIDDPDNLFCPPGCSPFVIYRNFTNPKQIQGIPNQNIPGYLQFSVYDDAGALLSESLGFIAASPASSSFSAGQFTDWSMTLLVSEC